MALRWETNGAALQWIYKYGNEAERHAALLQIEQVIRPPGQMNEKGLINPNLTSLFEHVYDNYPMDVVFSATAYLSAMELEYGQIAFTKPRSGRDARPFPLSKVTSSSPNPSH